METSSQNIYRNQRLAGLRSTTISVNFRSPNVQRINQDAFSLKLGTSQHHFLRDARIIAIESHNPNVLPCDYLGNRNVPLGVFERSRIRLKNNSRNFGNGLDLASLGKSTIDAPYTTLFLGGGQSSIQDTTIDYQATGGYQFYITNAPDTIPNFKSDSFIFTVWYMYPLVYERMIKLFEHQETMFKAIEREAICHEQLEATISDSTKPIKTGKIEFDIVSRDMQQNYLISLEAINPLISPNGYNGSVNVSFDIFQRTFITLCYQNISYITNLPLMSMSATSTISGRNSIYLGGQKVDFQQSYLSLYPENGFNMPNPKTDVEAYQFRLSYIERDVLRKYSDAIREIETLRNKLNTY